MISTDLIVLQPFHEFHAGEQRHSSLAVYLKILFNQLVDGPSCIWSSDLNLLEFKLFALVPSSHD